MCVCVRVCVCMSLSLSLSLSLSIYIYYFIPFDMAFGVSLARFPFKLGFVSSQHLYT